MKDRKKELLNKLVTDIENITVDEIEEVITITNPNEVKRFLLDNLFQECMKFENDKEDNKDVVSKVISFLIDRCLDNQFDKITLYMTSRMLIATDVIENKINQYIMDDRILRNIKPHNDKEI